MPDVQVTCITKPEKDSPHERITHLGGTNWKWTAEEVMDSIREGTNTFYTLVGNKRADVGIFEGENGDYLRTYADDYWDNNLLSLPQCR